MNSAINILIVFLIISMVAGFIWRGLTGLGKYKALFKRAKKDQGEAEEEAKHWQNIGSMSHNDIIDQLRHEADMPKTSKD